MTKQRQVKVLKKQQEKERATAHTKAKTNPIMQIDLDHINPKVKHFTLIRLKVLKRVVGQLEHL